MGKHQDSRQVGGKIFGAVVTAALAVLVLASAAYVRVNERRPADIANLPCGRWVHVMTATSFAPVLNAVSLALARGTGCVRVDVEVADGRPAAEDAAQADVWIPDDAAWAGSAQAPQLAAKGRLGSGTILATSPVYLVADHLTGQRITQAGGSWLALDQLLADGSGIRLTLPDPAGSGDGLVAAGALGEAVWLEQGMDASALALSKVVHVTRTVAGTAPALPDAPGEVGLVPEYALLPALAGLDPNETVLGTSDHTAQLRFAWFPTAAAAADPERSAVLERLRRALVGPAATAALRSAGLRQPGADAPPGAVPGRLPPLTAGPFDVLAPHHVDHVFATWYPKDRAMSLLIVVDVSGSMAKAAPQSHTALIDLVRQGCRTVGELLPDQARLGLWTFGVQLDPPRDYQTLMPTGPLDGTQRAALSRALATLSALPTGTALYNTVVAAYRSAVASYQPGMPNQVLVFTDGLNEDAPGSITAAQFAAQLAAASDPERPVTLTVVAFGGLREAATMGGALKPLGGGVHPLTTATEVEAVFIHASAGGLDRS